MHEEAEVVARCAALRWAKRLDELRVDDAVARERSDDRYAPTLGFQHEPRQPSSERAALLRLRGLEIVALFVDVDDLAKWIDEQVPHRSDEVLALLYRLRRIVCLRDLQRRSST